MVDTFQKTIADHAPAVLTVRDFTLEECKQKCINKGFSCTGFVFQPSDSTPLHLCYLQSGFELGTVLAAALTEHYQRDCV
jgi:hypothetical protein